MATQGDPGTLIWTVLPRARRGTVLQLSVLLSPRLAPAAQQATLGSGLYAEFGDWPAAARGVRFALAVDAGSGTPTPIGEVASDAGALDSALWSALMAPLTVAARRPPDPAPAAVASFAARPTYTNVVAGYRPDPNASAAASSAFAEGDPVAAMPSLRDGARRRALALVAPDDAARQRVRTEWQRVRAAAGATALSRQVEGSLVPAAQLFFEQASSYFDALNQGARQRVGQPRPVAPSLDFHDALTVYARYPWLLRRLGLVFDLEVDVGAALATLPATGRLSVQVVGTSSAWQHASPRSWYQLADDRFTLRPAPPDASSAGSLGIQAGLLAARDDDTAMTMDLDPLVQGLHAAALRFHAAPLAVAPPLPAPRSAGLSLARSGIDELLRSMLAHQQVLDDRLQTDPTGAGMEFNAEDLMRGYRVDIRRVNEPAWRSLHQRRGRYTLPDATVLSTLDDEGFATLRAFNPSAEAGALWTHESLFRWLGWSLSVPRPGQTVGTDGQVTGNVGDAGNLPLRVGFDPVPGSLPRLRFGQTYECRVRLVDLAGHSVALEDVTDAVVPPLPLGTYFRFDPVPAPALRLRDAAQPAESVDLIVLRSDLSGPAAGSAERWAAPPRGSAQLAEWHGMFDVAGGVDPAAYATLVAFDGALPATPYGADPGALPYLPDPLARGLWWLDDIDPPPALPSPPATMLPFGGRWPALQGIRIRLVEGSDEPAWDAATGVLTVSLPKGRTRQWRLASALDVGVFSSDDPRTAGSLFLLDTWGSLWEVPGSKLYNRREHQWKLLASGHDDQVTPYRRLRFVHAVPKPLVQPVLDGGRLVAVRPFFGTDAVFAATTPLDVPSTGHAELHGRWSDPVDDGVNPPSRQTLATQLGRTGIDDVATPPGVDSVVRFTHEFRDARHHRVTCWMVAATRYREYFPEITDPAQLTQTSSMVTVDVPASAPPARPKVLAVLPIYAFDPLADGTGAAVRRRTGLRVVLDRPWYSSGDDERLGVVMPIKPIDQPIFESGPGPGPLPGAPRGGGDGGGDIVLVDEPPSGIASGLVDVVSQWGADPALPGGHLGSPFAPLPRHFRNARDKAFLFTVVSDANGEHFVWDRVVSSFDVQFVPPDPADPGRPADPRRDAHDGHWIADLELQAAGDGGVPYAPFVRLALVRYQPFAPDGKTVLGSPMPPDHANFAKDMRVSEVVLADFVQLAPERSVSVVGDAAQVDVVVSGPGYLPHPDAVDATARPPAVLVVDAQVDIGDPGAPVWVGLTSAEATATALADQAGIVRWAVTLTLPFARGTRAQRLLLREYECLPADAGADIAQATIVRRLVYSDQLAI